MSAYQNDCDVCRLGILEQGGGLISEIVERGDVKCMYVCIVLYIRTAISQTVTKPIFHTGGDLYSPCAAKLSTAPVPL